MLTVNDKGDGMERKDVYGLIDGERAYQIERHVELFEDTPHSDENHSVGDWLIFMQEHVVQGMGSVYGLDTDDALNQVRKVAALAVACMEYNTTQPRKVMDKKIADVIAKSRDDQT